MSTPKRRVDKRKSLLHESFFNSLYLSPIRFIRQNKSGSDHSTPQSMLVSPIDIDESRVANQRHILFETDEGSTVQRAVADYFKTSHYPSPFSNSSQNPGHTSTSQHDQRIVSEQISFEFSDEQHKPETQRAQSNGGESIARQSLRKNLFHDTILRGLYLSPTAFINHESSSSNTNSTPRKFRWSIEHQSFMNPANIDESKALEQSSSLLETADDPKVQQAVNNYFKSCNFPSPHLPRPHRHHVTTSARFVQYESPMLPPERMDTIAED